LHTLPTRRSSDLRKADGAATRLDTVTKTGRRGLRHPTRSQIGLFNLARNDRSAADRLGEFGEEGVGILLGDAVDEARTKLGDLAPHISLDIVDEARATVFSGFETDRSPAFGEAGNAALALTADLVTVRSVDVAQSDFAFEARIDGADLDPCHGPEGVLAIRFERF